MNHTYIIGCGGVGSWLSPSLALLVGSRSSKDPNPITLIDGDKLETKNLNRQLFNAKDVGRFKAEALAERYSCSSDNRWFTFGRCSYDETDWLVCVVDNHPARLAVLQTCDMEGCQAIFASNETHSSEAFYYRRAWKSTRLDPRSYYPEIATSRAGDPMAAAIGCTGEAQEQNRQLVSANFSAAALAQHLFVLWRMEINKIGREAFPFLPYHLKMNLTSLEVLKVGQL